MKRFDRSCCSDAAAILVARTIDCWSYALGKKISHDITIREQSRSVNVEPGRSHHARLLTKAASASLFGSSIISCAQSLTT